MIPVEERSRELRYYHRNKAEINRKAREGDRRRKLMSRYGITPEQWEQMFQAQGSRCAICRTTESRGRGWVVDHSHQSGKVRGILCNSCNVAIGHFQDDLDVLKAATAYLEENSG